jgi:hypothetical protein
MDDDYNDDNTTTTTTTTTAAAAYLVPATLLSITTRLFNWFIIHTVIRGS